ncbi:MAG: hypothetical protein WDN44_04340 [Sphingomonas sp.]
MLHRQFGQLSGVGGRLGHEQARTDTHAWSSWLSRWPSSSAAASAPGDTRAWGRGCSARGGAGLAPESPVTANATDTALQRIGRNPATKEQAIYWAAIFNNYVTSDGLDTFLSTLRHREWDLDDFTAALVRIGAGALAGILRRADEAIRRMPMRKSAIRIRSVRRTAGNCQGSSCTDACLEKGIDESGIDLAALLERYAIANPVRTK